MIRNRLHWVTKWKTVVSVMVLLPRKKNVRDNKFNSYEEYSLSDLENEIRIIYLCNKWLLKKLINFKNLKLRIVCPCKILKGSRFCSSKICLFGSVQSLSRVRLSATPINRITPGLPVHHQLPEFTQTHVHRVSDAKQPSCPLSLPFPPAPNPSQHQSLFQWVSSSMRWPKYWSFSFSIIPSKEHPGLISFRMDWLDLLAAQGTLKSLLQHHSSKASILWCSAFFTVQLSHPYMTTGKTIALTRRTLLAK